MAPNTRPIHVTMTKNAGEELKKVAKELGVSEAELLRRGLIGMMLYVRLTQHAQD